MEDFYYAGGLRGAARSRLRDLLHTRLHHGQRPHAWRQPASTAVVCNDEVIAPRERPSAPEGGVAVLRGNLAPDGAVIKHTAADRRLLQHTGPAVVFRNYNDLEARIDDPALPVTADSVLVLQNAGPLGAPGHARVGHAADPEEAAGAGRPRHGADLRRAHERHELRRLRPARRAGVVRRRPAGLRARRRHHRARRARAAADAPCADDELARRRADWKPREVQYPRGFGRMYATHVTQANRGCDFDFLEGTAPIAEPEIH